MTSRSPNHRSPTLDEVAALAGVSRMTASRAVNNRPGVSEQVREDILRIAKEIGYVVNRAAQKLASGGTRVIGLVTIYLHSPFTTEFMSGAARAARTAGYEILLYSLLEPDEKLREGVTQLLAQSALGVISVLPHRQDYFAALAAANVPVITVESAQAAGFDIRCDNYNGARTAMRHLLDLGHRRIGHIIGNERIASALERRRAYDDAVIERGLELDPSLVEKGDYSQPAGFVAARRLLALPHPPTAIFAGADCAALGVLEAAHAAGLRVPEDLSVVGFDDIPQAAQAHPPLTTIRQPIEQMGRSAVNTLLAVLAGIEPVSPVITFPTDLIVRGSTAPPNPKRAGGPARKRRTKPRCRLTSAAVPGQ
jgi:LacI family transcriptional regulator